MNVKQTPLTDKHIALGAKMAAFAGYNMPVVYSTIAEEHMAVRDSVGVFDVSHMGEFIVKGKGALELVQKITTNNASKLMVGDAQYSCMPNLEGGIVDDLLVYRLPCQNCAEDEIAFMLVVNAGNLQKDWDWVNAQNSFDAKVSNISDRTGLIAIQGPNTIDLLQPLTEVDLSDIGFYKFRKGKFAGVENVLISATGYTGAGGFELYAEAGDTEVLWDAIFAQDRAYPVRPAGLGARDTLRLEMGYCLYGNDIDETTSPIEAGLGWITKTKKGQFNSVEIFARERTEGISRKLVGFTLRDRRVPRHGYEILNEAGNVIGTVTSGTQSPCLDKPIGMGYVSLDYAKPGTEVIVSTGRKELSAVITKLPFYHKDTE